jgi:hypothetical protein
MSWEYLSDEEILSLNRDSRKESTEEWFERVRELLLKNVTIWKISHKDLEKSKKDYDECPWMSYVGSEKGEDGIMKYRWELDEDCRMELTNKSTGHFHELVVSPPEEVPSEE